MPLLDHFHPPLEGLRHWESFHAAWAGEIMAALNEEVLPPNYYAETQVHAGPRIEVDVASIGPDGGAADGGSSNGVAVAAYTETTVQTMPAVFPPTFEVQVIHAFGGPVLVGAIELVSPRNKDRPEARRAFAAKCASYLHAGVGLVVVDIVTNRHSNLHDELIDLLQQEPAYRFAGTVRLYSVAYRPFRHETDGERIEMRSVTLKVGEPLPVMPLALRNGPTVPVDLESTYERTRRRSRL